MKFNTTNVNKIIYDDVNVWTRVAFYLMNPKDFCCRGGGGQSNVKFRHRRHYKITPPIGYVETHRGEHGKIFLRFYRLTPDVVYYIAQKWVSETGSKITLVPVMYRRNIKVRNYAKMNLCNSVTMYNQSRWRNKE